MGLQFRHRTRRVRPDRSGPQWSSPGPTARRSKDGNVYFSDVRGNRIMRLATDGDLNVVRSPANPPNGMVIDELGRLIVCEA